MVLTMALLLFQEWKKLADATAGARSLPSAAVANNKVAVGGVSCEEEGAVNEQQADADAYSTLFHGSLDRSSRAAASAAEAHRVVDAYSNFLGTPPPPDTAAELQLAEVRAPRPACLSRLRRALGVVRMWSCETRLGRVCVCGRSRCSPSTKCLSPAPISPCKSSRTTLLAKT